MPVLIFIFSHAGQYMLAEAVAVKEGGAARLEKAINPV